MTIADNIRLRNEAFAGLSPSDQRVAIARDVIQQVLLKRFIPEAGTYVSSGTGEKCNVCAIGAIAVSLLGSSEAMDEVRWIRQSQMTNYFSHDTLREMEAAFEMSSNSRLDGVETQENYAGLWGDNGLDDSEQDQTRLLIVFANVINNGGEFVPENLENEIEAFKRAGAAYWYGLAGMAQPVS